MPSGDRSNAFERTAQRKRRQKRPADQIVPQHRVTIGDVKQMTRGIVDHVHAIRGGNKPRLRGHSARGQEQAAKQRQADSHQEQTKGVEHKAFSFLVVTNHYIIASWKAQKALFFPKKRAGVRLYWGEVASYGAALRATAVQPE